MRGQYSESICRSEEVSQKVEERGGVLRLRKTHEKRVVMNQMMEDS